MVREADHTHLLEWQQLVHDPFIAPDASRLDRYWNWPRYYAASHLANGPVGRATTAFQLLVPDADGRAFPVGTAMLVSGYPHPGNHRVRSAFVWFLTSAPRSALLAHGIEDQFVVMPLILDTAVQISRLQGLEGRVALHADQRGTAAQQADLVSRYERCGLTRRNHLRGTLLSLFRRMDDRYFVYDEASAHACTIKWNHLR